MDQTWPYDIERVRAHFNFVGAGRVVTNNAASTQPPRALVDLYRELSPGYENVHRGHSQASREMTRLFESSFETIASWVNAPSPGAISLHRNTSEAINAVMYTLLTEFRDGDNLVTTLMEHNSDYVPWYGVCREILPRFGRRVEYRLARFDQETGRLDLDHLASLVDERTKLVCCTGASNFLGTKPPLDAVRRIANASGYLRPGGGSGSLLLVDAAQLAPSSHVDVQALDVDYLAFSFHKLLAPFGVGVLYAKEHLRAESLPFLYGGDMIAEGRVTPEQVDYGDLPWKFSAGTPNILGAIVSAQALRFAVDLVGADETRTWFRTERPLPQPLVRTTMERISRHCAMLTDRALAALASVPGITIYGVPRGEVRSPLVAFNVRGLDPFRVAEALDERGVEARAGCHCATLAHHDLGLDPPASCRLSFYLYNSIDDVDRAVDAVRDVVSSLSPRAPARSMAAPA